MKPKWNKLNMIFWYILNMFQIEYVSAASHEDRSDTIIIVAMSADAPVFRFEPILRRLAIRAGPLAAYEISPHRPKSIHGWNSKKLVPNGFSGRYLPWWKSISRRRKGTKRCWKNLVKPSTVTTHCSVTVWFNYSRLTFQLDTYVYNLEISKLWDTKIASSGQIPSCVGELPELLVLDLSWNQLSGKIPRLANLKMRHLDLEGNKLSGKMPKDLGQLPQLVNLTLGWFGEFFDKFTIISNGSFIQSD